MPMLQDLPRRVRRGVCLLGLLAVLSPLAVASGFQVAPTIATVPAGGRVAEFQLRNNGDAPVTVQADLLAWSQTTAGGDTLVPASGALVVPRVATLAPHATQLVRVALQAPGSAERAFRLRLREVPPPPPPGFMGVRTLIEQLVPVFFMADGQPAVSWHARMQSGGGLDLAAENTGARHLALSAIRLLDARGAVLAERSGPGYVLAGQGTFWPLETHARLKRGEAIRLEFLSHGKTQDVPLAVE